MIDPSPAGEKGLAICASLACIWEASAPKPGNVYRGADFEDLTYVDLVASAAVIGPVVAQSARLGVGAAVYQAVCATRSVVATNANLGIVLLLAPLAAVADDQLAEQSLNTVLHALTVDDANHAYAAIRAASPGGLGRVGEADVMGSGPCTWTLLEAMRLAADRDLIARQYAGGFQETFVTAERIAVGHKQWALGDAIVRAQLELLAETPDTLIVRKCGPDAAQQASDRAAEALAAGTPGDPAYRAAVADLDFYLRDSLHRRNPGATADVVAAALFVLLRQGRVDFPVHFYGDPADTQPERRT